MQGILHFLQPDQAHALIEKKKQQVKDIYDFHDYCQIAIESSAYTKSYILETWDFRHWKSGKSDAKVKKANIPHIVTFKTVSVKKGMRCLYYNLGLGEPLIKLPFLNRNYKLVAPRRHEKPRGLNLEKHTRIMKELVPAMPKEKQVCAKLMVFIQMITNICRHKL